MDAITTLFKLNIPSIIIGIFIIISALIASVEIIGKFSNIIGKPVKWVRKKNEDHDLLIKTAQNLAALQQKHDDDVNQSIRHDDLIKSDLNEVSNKMDALSEQISNMQNKFDETEMVKLKNSIVGYYKKYKDIGEWSQLENDVFWDLFERYEAHGGNGFVHTVVEPIMRDINIVN